VVTRQQTIGASDKQIRDSMMDDRLQILQGIAGGRLNQKMIADTRGRPQMLSE
jgi:hypothetical protein